MEAQTLLLTSSPFFFNPSLSPSKPTFTTTTSAVQSTTPHQRHDFSTTQNSKPSKFKYQDDFPSSLPLHTKNPHVLYRHITRFAYQNKIKQAIIILDYLYHRGIPINATTFSSLLTACARNQSLHFGRQVHVHIRTNNLEGNEFLVSKLVHMYSACNSPEEARKVLEAVGENADVYAWNGLLRGNLVGGRRWSLEILKIFDEMRELGVDLNVYSYSCLVKSVAGSPNLGFHKIYDQIHQNGEEMSIINKEIKEHKRKPICKSEKQSSDLQW